jgi:photosystem II stability/assembly factor-like uncharacterized protein
LAIGVKRVYPYITEVGDVWTAVDIGLPFCQFLCLLESSTGRVLGGGGGVTSSGGGTAFRKSDTNGTSWAIVGCSISSLIISNLFQTATGRILATGTHIMKSDDDGDTWNPIAGTSYNFNIANIVQTASGKMFAVANGLIYNTIDDGDNWTTSSFPSTSFQKLLYTGGTRILAFGIANTILYRYSNNDGSSWNYAYLPAGDVYTPIKLSSGRVLAIGEGGNLVYSDDDGATWDSGSIGGLTGFKAICQATTGRVIATRYPYDGIGVIVSDDDGETWNQISIPYLQPWQCCYALSTGRVLAGSLSGQPTETVMYSK